jgi:enamine deaminase RidA (YjgF/YER057c/UK114 family)
MHTVSDILQFPRQPLLTSAVRARTLAIAAQDSDDAYDQLVALLQAQCEALSAGQLDAWLALVTDGAAEPRFDEQARRAFEVALEGVCETVSLPDGQVHQLIAIPMAADGAQALWEGEVPGDMAAQVEAIYRRHGLLAADARLTLLPAVLEPGAAAALSPSAVFYLTRLLARGDIEAAFREIDEDLENFEASPVLQLENRFISGGVLLALATGCEDGLFPLDQACWEALAELDTMDEEGEAPPAALQERAQACHERVQAALAAAGAELATLLEVTALDLLAGPNDFYSSLEEVLHRCRMLEARARLGNAARTHTGGELARLALGAELEARPDGGPGFLVSLFAGPDGAPVDGFIWGAVRGETAEDTLAALAAVLEHAGVTCVAMPGGPAGASSGAAA